MVHDTRPSATIARLLLGDQLHQLRAARRLTLQTVAGATYLSVSKLSRIECGRHRAAPADIQRLIDLYETPGALRGQLLKWAARAQGRSVYHSFGDVTDAALRDYLDVEPWALSAVYAPSVIPAVLQTRRYARELLAEMSQAEESGACGCWPCASSTLPGAAARPYASCWARGPSPAGSAVPR